MTRDDIEAFSRMLTLAAQQYGRALSPELAMMYFDGLSHLPLEAVRDALGRHLRDPDVGQFMPKIADIIRKTDGGGNDAAYLALIAVQRAFSSPGAWESVSFDDPAINAVVRDMGGWPALCARDAEEWNRFGAQDFMRRYRVYRERGAADAPEHLPGFFELTNKGITPDNPVRSIGDALRDAARRRLINNGGE